MESDPIESARAESEPKAGGRSRVIVLRGAEKVSREDVDQVAGRARDLEDRFRKVGPLRRFLADGLDLVALVSDCASGRYDKIPFRVLAAVIFACLYILNPFDLVPDLIPFFGYLDDASVVAACLSLVKKDLDIWREWRRSGAGGEPDSEPGHKPDGAGKDGKSG